jgi:uncharacterized low-complexity protein
MKPVAVAVGTAFVASLATAAIANTANPFAADELDKGYDQLAQADAEGKCGEGKCGEESKDEGEGKCGESGASGDESKDEAEGKCGESGASDDESKDEGEGKCGEGKCGESA